MNSRQAISGLLDDLENLVRPKDAQGNPLPMTTVDVSMNYSTIIKLGTAAILVGMLISVGNRKLAKRIK